MQIIKNIYSSLPLPMLVTVYPIIHQSKMLTEIQHWAGGGGGGGGGGAMFVKIISNNLVPRVLCEPWVRGWIGNEPNMTFENYCGHKM